MRRSFGRIIILPPSSSRIHRLRYTRTAVGFVVAVGLLALCAILVASYAIPPPVPDMERVRIEKENQILKAEKNDLEMQTKQLQNRVSRLEEMSKRITDAAGKE